MPPSPEAPAGRGMAPGRYGADAAEGWSTGATLVYGPLAETLAARSPEPLAGRLVVDVGAGTGVGSVALRRAGAVPIAVDFSAAMLSVEVASRPPSVAGDATALPLRSRSVEGAYAAFVLNHLTEPVAGLRELGRVVRPGDPIVADVYSSTSSHPARDRVDAVCQAWGWETPDWYLALKERVIPLLGSAANMRAAAIAAGLVDVEVDQCAVDVGVTAASDLVAYRLGQAHIAAFLATLDAGDRAALVEDATAAADEVMTPYRPVVVFLSARG